MRITARPTVGKTAQSMGEGRYSVELQPSVGIPASMNAEPGSYVDVTDVGKVSIRFNVEVEAREWGIKGISISVAPGVVETQAVVINGEQESELKIQFDPSRVPLQLRPGSQVTLTGLELSLGEGFVIDYENSYFEGTTLMGTRE